MDSRRSRREQPVVIADGRVPIEFVSPNPRNPRRNFADAELTDLAQSIREHGIVQPVLVRRASVRPAATRSSPASAAGAPPSAPA